MKDIVTKIHEALITKDNIKDAVKANSVTKRFKDFEDVREGDKGEDYNGEKGNVTMIGTAEEIAKEDKYGMMQALIDEGMAEPEQGAVICTMEDNGDGIAYVYGGDGFQCYEE